MDISTLIENLSKIIGSICSIATLLLTAFAILPQLRMIHKQTNSLAARQEASARKEGLQEGLLQAATSQTPGETAAAIIAAGNVAAARMLEAAREARAEKEHDG